VKYLAPITAAVAIGMMSYLTFLVVTDEREIAMLRERTAPTSAALDDCRTAREAERIGEELLVGQLRDYDDVATRAEWALELCVERLPPKDRHALAAAVAEEVLVP
jgi:hypothetical protein